MDSIHICGGEPLLGETHVQGSKNAVLPILAAAVLIPGICVLRNCPKIADVFYMTKLLQSIGCSVAWEDDSVMIDASVISGNSLPSEYVTRMRSSIIMMGAILGRMKEVNLDYPGGCVIGERPIDIHIEAIRRMGVTFLEREDGLLAVAQKLEGTVVPLSFPSVGATENVLLAAALAKGTTRIENAAREPEIESLCAFLAQAGARITREQEGAVIIVEGVERLHSCEYRIPSDRIVAGTYLFACMAAGGGIFLREAPAGHLKNVLDVIARMGGRYRYDVNGIYLDAPYRQSAIPFLKTEVYPGFPTDLQSPLMTALCVAEGESVIEEAIFESRFKIVGELKRMGARVTVKNSCAWIEGRKKLHGQQVVARELRGGAALVIAGLAAEGITVVSNRHFIDRGYEDIEKDLRCLGGRI